MTGSLAATLAPQVTALTTLPATGAAHAAWLLLAFPGLGALVLLLGGKRTNAWGHWLGVLMSLAAFVYGVVLFVQLLGQPASRRSFDLHVFTFIPGIGRFVVPLGMILMALLIAVRLITVGVRHDDPISSREAGH